VLLDSSIRKLDRKSLKVVATGNPYDLSYFHTLPNKEHLLLPNVNVTLKFHYEDVRQALKILFRNTNASYSLAPDVTGKVTASLANVPLGKALPFLLKQVECTFHVEGGVVLILKGLHPTFHLYQEKVTAHSIANDGDWILLFFGKEIFKFSKKRMRTEEVIRY
jgi:type II secretory pathway component GspD/PulD (secretin)